MKKFWTKEVKIGLSAIICLVAMFVVIQFMKGINVMKPANHYTVTFENVSDLIVSSPVTVSGYKVGVVHDMKMNYETKKVEVMINLDKEMRIPRDSKITLAKTLMGNGSLVIDANPYVSEYYEPGDVIEGSNGNDLMAGLANMMPQLQSIVGKVDSIMTGVQAITNDPAFKISIERLDGITANLQNTTSELDKVMRNDLPVLLGNVNSICNNVDSLTTTLNTLPIDATFEQINTLMSNIQDATAQLNKTDNTAGKLLNDEQLYNRLNQAVFSLDSLLIDIRQNPKRYINIKVF